MAKYIPLDALIAEIKERIKTYNKGYANGDDRRADALDILLHDPLTLVCIFFIAAEAFLLCVVMAEKSAPARTIKFFTADILSLLFSSFSCKNVVRGKARLRPQTAKNGTQYTPVFAFWYFAATENRARFRSRLF